MELSGSWTTSSEQFLVSTLDCDSARLGKLVFIWERRVDDNAMTVMMLRRVRGFGPPRCGVVRNVDTPLVRSTGIRSTGGYGVRLLSIRKKPLVWDRRLRSKDGTSSSLTARGGFSRGVSSENGGSGTRDQDR